MKNVKHKVRTRYRTNHNAFNLEVHHQQENMMVSNVACVITSYL
jgi:hypothetical protein